MEYRGKVAIVTGASSGIGSDLARSLARRGATVVAVARREERLAAVVEACRVDAPASSYLAGDLSDRSFAARVIDDTLARHGRVDILVNNAAAPLHKELYRISLAEAEALIETNFLSCLRTTWRVIPAMLRQGEGTIVNVSSFASKVAPTNETVYVASKAAMNGLSEGLWNDLAGSGIHVALVHPGPIDTEIWQKLDQPGAYSGKKYPPELVTRAILDAIDHRRHEVLTPRTPALLTARALRLLFPALLRRALRRLDPVPPESITTARTRAQQGRHLGE